MTEQEAVLAELDRHRETTAGRDDLIVRAYEAGVPALQIGVRGGIGRNTVYRVLKSRGVELRGNE